MTTTASIASEQGSTRSSFPRPAICLGLLHTQAVVPASGASSLDVEREATRMAVSAWQTKAESYFGAGFESWESAQDRSVTCRERDGSRMCIASAYPCQAGTSPKEPG